jgi:hypothetical protein
MNEAKERSRKRLAVLATALGAIELMAIGGAASAAPPAVDGAAAGRAEVGELGR